MRRQGTRKRLIVREVRVAVWLGFGETLWKITLILAMVDRIAEKHSDRIYRKRGVHSRVEFLLYCFAEVPADQEGGAKDFPHGGSS